METNRELTPDERRALLDNLQARFEANKKRHAGLDWADVAARLETQPAKLWSLAEMERTGGEPDVVGQDAATGEFIFVDCCAESPAGRRNCCYDPKGQKAREKKDVPVQGNALDLAAAMGAELLDEEQYRRLQSLGEFDTVTSSWVQTPEDIHKLGGALFGDRRFGHVFIYHNGASSFYSSRAFRAALRV